MPMMTSNLALLLVFQLAARELFFVHRQNLLHRFTEFLGWLFFAFREHGGLRHRSYYAYSMSCATLDGVARNFALEKSTCSALTFAAFNRPAIVNSLNPTPSIPTTSPDLSTSIVTTMLSELRSNVLATLDVRNRTYIAPHSVSNSITGGLGLCTTSLCVSLAGLICGNQPAVAGFRLGYYFQCTFIDGFFKFVDDASV